mgnify:CR=1 FL=1
MKKTNKLIILLSIVAIIIIMIIMTTIFMLNKKENDELKNTDGKGLSEQENLTFEQQKYKKLNDVENANAYYSISTIAIKYFNYIKDYNTDITYSRLDEAKKISQKQKQEYFNNIKSLYKMDNISEQELLNKIKLFNNIQYFWVEQMYNYKIDENKEIYPVDGYVLNGEDDLIRVVLFIQIDMKNNTFNILQEEYNENINDLVGKIEFNQIEKNENNEINFTSITENDWIDKLFNKYKQEMINSPDYFYTKLNSEYAQKRFGNIENFKSFVKENYVSLYSAKIKKYKINKYDSYTQYVVIDQNSDYYIINQEKNFTYNICLDSYTVTTDDSNKKYDEATEKEKIQINLGKFLEAINMKDYQYVYNHLDETFKENHFNSINQFIEYTSKNFYDKNSVELLEYTKQSDVYVYNLRLKNNKDVSQTKQIKVVLKLLDNREYTMSFQL